jgi:NAD/NADP transhydrogenase beta subunit
MAETTTTVGECGVPLARLGMALIVALVGFLVAVMGFVVDNAPMIVVGMLVGGSGSVAVNWLANAVTDGAGEAVDSLSPGAGRP